MKRRNFVEIICLLFVLLFVYAGSAKLADFEKFKVQLGQSPLLTNYAVLVAWLVPGLEFIIAVGLCVGRFRQLSLYAAFGLMTMFSAYIFIITRYSDIIPCSCGGVLSQLNWQQHLIFNITFIFLAAIAVIINNPDKKIPI